MILRENLLRSVPFELARAEEDEAGDGLTLTGYAAVWDSPSKIDSWEGRFTEKIRRGAFRKSIRERTPVLQFEHGRHPLLGSIPIGRIEELREDDQGLYVQARLSDNWLIEPVRQSIADGAVSGMSFRFTVIRDEWRDSDGKLVKPEELYKRLWDPGERGPLECTLIEVRCHELGPVVFPAYDATSVDVRARSVAALIGEDRQLAREVRASLARDVIPPPAPGIEDLGDPDVRRGVARMLLFGSSEGPPGGRPSATQPRQSAGLSVEDAPPEGHPSTPTRSTDAPAESHPPESTDAPPAEGHPSTASQGRLRSQIREIRELMEQRLATIDKDG